jgi:hypothetical protein
MVLRPAIEDLRECSGLAAACRQVLFQHEHQHDVALGGEVSDILSDYGAAFGPCDHRDFCVASSAPRRPTSATWTAW